MAKRKNRIQNPEPFVPDGDESVKSRKRSKAPKHHQMEAKLISANISSKIMKEAFLQQKEIQREDEASNNNNNNAFHELEDTPNFEEFEDDDDFAGFSETQSQFEEGCDEINEEEERLLDAFMSRELEQGQEQTIADVMLKRIKENAAAAAASENRPVPKLDKSTIDIYKGVGAYLSKYTTGKLPKAFKLIPSMPLWEEVLYLTEPENWSPNAIYQATIIFSSNFGVKKAERFNKLVLLPRMREDIRKNKFLHFFLCQALKKSLYKPSAFFKGIIIPLCESRTCTNREAVIIGGIINKFSIPVLPSSAALLKLAEMEYSGPTSYFIKLLLEKKYAVPYSVIDALVSHFMRFLNETEILPVIWHQTLLAFVQRYKNGLQKEDKDNLRVLLEKQNHKLVTPEIIRELNNSCNRGQREDDLMSISSPVTMIIKTIEEDRFDIPDVPMEED